MKKIIITLLLIVLTFFTISIFVVDRRNMDEMNLNQNSAPLEISESTEECRVITNDVEKEPDEQAWCDGKIYNVITGRELEL